MFYDTFDTGFGMAPGFDSFDGGFESSMFNGMECFPAPSFDMGFNGGFPLPPFNSTCGMGMPITCGYSSTPFGCNPVSMDLSGNVCIDGIPITPNTPPAWMTARAMQAEMHFNQLESQLNDPNFWMNFIPQNAFTMPPFSPVDTSSFDWSAVSTDASIAPIPLDTEFPMAFDPMSETPMSMSDFGNPGVDSSVDTPMMWKGEEVLPCGLTQSAYDSILASYQKNLADCERQLESIDPYHSAQRAMIQNTIDRTNRHIKDLDKPLGTI